MGYVNSGRNDPSHTFLPSISPNLYNHPYEEQGYYYYMEFLHFLFLNMNINSITIGVIKTITILSKSPISKLELSPTKPYYGQEHHNHHAFNLSYLHYLLRKSFQSIPLPSIIYLHQYHQHDDTTYYVNHFSTPLSKISLCNSLFNS